MLDKPEGHALAGERKKMVTEERSAGGPGSQVEHAAEAQTEGKYYWQARSK